MGQGIFVCNNVHELEFQLKNRKKYVNSLFVSEYIERPLLLRGLKFDLRVYVLVVCMAPLRVYIYDEGLVRYATTSYSSRCKSSQLTNYSLNHQSKVFKNATSMDDQTSHKQSFAALKEQLAALGIDVDKVNGINDCRMAFDQGCRCGSTCTKLCSKWSFRCTSTALDTLAHFSS